MVVGMVVGMDVRMVVGMDVRMVLEMVVGIPHGNVWPSIKLPVTFLVTEQAVSYRTDQDGRLYGVTKYGCLTETGGE
jgi:hypothetical protein